MKGLPPVTAEGLLYGLGAVVLAWLLSHVVRRMVRRVLVWRGRSPSSAEVLARLAGWVLVFLGVGAGLTIAFPSIRPVDVLGGVGVISIAAGIAFQTVLGNMFAGIVLVTRDVFRVGDQIAVGEHWGTISQIDITSTRMRTFDGRLVVIPNSVLHSEILTVQTGFEYVRTSVALDIDDLADLGEARRVAIEAMAQLPAVLDDPAPDALFCEVGTNTVRLELRFWSGSLQLETRTARHAVISAVLDAFRAHGIKTGSGVVVLEPGPHAQRLLQPRPDDMADHDRNS